MSEFKDIDEKVLRSNPSKKTCKSRLFTTTSEVAVPNMANIRFQAKRRKKEV